MLAYSYCHTKPLEFTYKQYTNTTVLVEGPDRESPGGKGVHLSTPQPADLPTLPDFPGLSCHDGVLGTPVELELLRFGVVWLSHDPLPTTALPGTRIRVSVLWLVKGRAIARLDLGTISTGPGVPSVVLGTPTVR